VTADGELHRCDVLIYGTGFQPSRFLTPMKVVGRGGVDLHHRWDGDARAYLGVTVPGFPNFFMLYGPNTNIVVNGSIIWFTECEVRYVMDHLRTVLAGGHRGLDVKADVHDRYNEAVVPQRQGPGGPELALPPGRVLGAHPGPRPGRLRPGLSPAVRTRVGSRPGAW
jgi:4-hydroxyacetophenone monooxygenase